MTVSALTRPPPRSPPSLLPRQAPSSPSPVPRPDLMEPGGSELDSSPPQPENPCLIVEDSQPDSVALEDDPESSYRALLARRLSSLQPTSRSPVLVSTRRLQGVV